MDLTQDLDPERLEAVLEQPFDYTADELLVFAESIGHVPPAGVGGEVWEGLASDCVDAVRGAGLRALLAHGVLDLEGNGLAVLPPHAFILALALAPGLVVVAQRVTLTEIEQRRYHVRPTAALEHSRLHSHIHRFVPFESRLLLERLETFLAIEDRPHRALPSASTDVRILIDAERATMAGDEVAFVAAQDERLRPFARALISRVQTCEIGSRWRVDHDTVTGSELKWIDGGDEGLWILEPLATPAGDRYERLVVEHVTADHIRQCLLDLLPGAD